MMADPDARPDDFVRPGHINPSGPPGGLVRTGQTEGSISVGLRIETAAAIIEVVKTDGEMARLPDLEEMCREHDLKMCSVEQIIEHRLAGEAMVSADPVGRDITPKGSSALCLAEHDRCAPHIALCTGGIGELGGDGAVVETEEPLVRVQRATCWVTSSGCLRKSDRSSRDDLMASLRAIRTRRWSTCDPNRVMRNSGLLHEVSRVEEDVNAPDLARPDGGGEGGAHGSAGTWDRKPDLRDLGFEAATAHQPPRPWPTLQRFGLEVVDSVPLADRAESTQASASISTSASSAGFDTSTNTLAGRISPNVGPMTSAISSTAQSPW